MSLWTYLLFCFNIPWVQYIIADNELTYICISLEKLI